MEELNVEYPDPLQNPDAEAGLPADHRSGFIAVIGRPNVGKSTLLNRLLGQKVAITSPKPQTTRDRILGILTTEDAQMLFLDTPGIHRPLHKLGEYMVQVAADAIADADVVLWLVDINMRPTEEEQAIIDLLRHLTTRKRKRIQLPPLILGLNQIDRWHGDAEATAARVREYTALLDWLPEKTEDEQPALQTVLLSAATGAGIEALLALVRSLLPAGPRLYPEDQITDMNLRHMVAEIIREKALLLLQDEVPHCLAVEVDEFVERSEKLTYISAVLYVERESQKPIVLGKGGSMIKRIGQMARPEIEELVGTKVYLELWVKVWERWRRRQNLLKQLGYAVQQRQPWRHA
ncbi:GTPase Era [Caldilinea sp.]|jgi:GTP-binding protein Era|uniref:GTPase Era n=1 Tax=Caldilinea sp. TaxID=2293560 RepID=UPI001B22E22E|nr:GTPase Era [Caldilinea sp.]MBO9392479.1 GTPase Era [Caldilinea sp.]